MNRPDTAALSMLLIVLALATYTIEPNAWGQQLEDPVLSFEPEEHGRRQISVSSVQKGFQWRLRIPERVFCDEGVLVGHDIHRVHDAVRWHRSPNGSLQYHRRNIQDSARDSLPLQIRYTLKVQPAELGATLSLGITNTGQRTLHNVTGHICLGHLSEPFRDPQYDRTFIRHDGEFLNLRGTDRGLDPVRAHYLVRDQQPIKIFTHPQNRFWGRLSAEAADNGLILTRSRDATQLVALWFDPASEVFQNSDEPNMCIHSDPVFGDLEPGASREVDGRLMLFPGTLAEFANRYLNGE